MSVLKYFALLVLISLVATGCDDAYGGRCHDDFLVRETMSIDDYIKREEIDVSRITVEMYDSIISDERIDIIVHMRSATPSFFAYDMLYLKRLYVDERLRCDLIGMSSFTEFGYSKYNSSKGCNQTHSYFAFDTGTFIKGKAFKVDKDNRDHFYLYYNDSWWMWDISKLNINFDDRSYCLSYDELNNSTANIKLGF